MASDHLAEFHVPNSKVPSSLTNMNRDAFPLKIKINLITSTLYWMGKVALLMTLKKHGRPRQTEHIPSSIPNYCAVHFEQFFKVRI